MENPSLIETSNCKGKRETYIKYLISLSSKNHYDNAVLD